MVPFGNKQHKLELDNYLNSIRKTESIIVFYLDNFFIPKVVFVFVSVFCCCVVFVLHLVRHSLGNIASIISFYIGIGRNCIGKDTLTSDSTLFLIRNHNVLTK